MLVYKAGTRALWFLLLLRRTGGRCRTLRKKRNLWLSESEHGQLPQLSMTSLTIQGIWWCDCTWLRHLSTALGCVDAKGCTCPWKLKLPGRKLYLGHKFDIPPMQMSNRLEEIICYIIMPGCWVSKGTYSF